jgi:hypothetical protein
MNFKGSVTGNFAVLKPSMLVICTVEIQPTHQAHGELTGFDLFFVTPSSSIITYTQGIQ